MLRVMVKAEAPLRALAPGSDKPEPPSAAEPRGASVLGLPRNLVGVAAVAGIVAIGLAFRFYTRSALWSDEVLSINISALPLRSLGHALRQDGAPPLYYVALHVWMRIFGTSNEAVRALSGLAAVLTLPPAWFCGRRLDERRIAAGRARPGSRTVAWSSLVILSASPFAIRYGTETRMYAFVILFVTVGYLAVLRSLEQPTPLRLAIVAALGSALLFTHYWSLILLGAVGVGLLYEAARGPVERRRGAWFTAAALVVSGVTFIPWVPTFLYQIRHTGTPWGAVASPISGTAAAFVTFGGNTHVMGWSLLVMGALAVFAHGLDRRHLEVDLLSRPGVRGEAVLAIAVLVGGLSLSFLQGTTFEGRYAAVIFPLVLLAAAFGVTVFTSRAVRYGVLALLVVGGFWGGASNALRSRTQAFEVANAITPAARPGDMVAYCPDSIGIDVRPLLPADLRQVTFPRFDPPIRINWADYDRRIDAASTKAFARELVARTGPMHDLWFVWAPGVEALSGKCGQVIDALTVLRPHSVRLVEPNPYFFENQGLIRYAH